MRTLGACLLGLWLAGCAAPPAATGPEEAAPVAAASPAAAPKRAKGAAKPAPPQPTPEPPPVAGAGQDTPDDTSSTDDSVLLGRGLASWYGPQFHGRRTASGERFDRGALTAAHRSLPFGARVCVRSLVNGKVVVVRVNDRGPFTPGRVIDLSQAAAEELGMTGLGIKPVEIWHMQSEDEDCPDKLPELDEDAALQVRAPAPTPRPVARKRAARRR